jgi:AraC-like DNA-binding protein
MSIDTHDPSPPLASLVSSVWHCEGYVLPHAWERIMPSAGTTLLVNLREDTLSWRRLDGRHLRIAGIGLCGPQEAAFEINTAQQRHILGVEFQPGGASRILGVPANELASWHVGLGDLCGNATARRLHEQLVAAPDAQARFQIIERWLLARWARGECASLLAPEAISLVERMPIGALESRLGISSRRLTAAFRAEIGLAPKRYCRVRRFEALLRNLPLQAPVNWALTAAGHGYYDQAHLSHEFRELSGYSPSEYLTHRGPYVRHVPLDA